MTNNWTVSTDKNNYMPGDIVVITARGFAVGSTIEFAIEDDPDDFGDDGNADVYQPFSVTDGGASELDDIANGEVLVVWRVPTDNNGTGSGTPDASNARLILTATGSGADRTFGTTDDQVATTTFTDADPALLQTYFVPVPEQQVNYIFNDLENNVSDGIISIISMTMSRDGTLIYYDQWENGYDSNITNPTNIYSIGNPGGTQIWGDGIDENGAAPGITGDIFKAGDIVVLRNVVPTNPRGTQIYFDGGDKIGATTAIAVTRGYWPQTVEGSGGSVLGGAVEVFDIFRYGKEYKVPVGQNLTNDNGMFSYAGLAVGAAQDNTVVQIDVNGDGDFADATDVNVTLNQGQTYVVRGTGDGSNPSLPSGPGINVNSRVLASNPVQVDLVTGVINANFQSDSFALKPLDKLGNSYYSPVTTTVTPSNNSGPVSYFLYNPGSGTITVNYRTTADTGDLTVAAGETVRYTPTVSGSGIHFYTGDLNNPNGGNFDVIATYDSATSNYIGQNWDWGWTLTPQNGLTSQVVVGWAQGSSDTNGNVVAGANGSPLWVTATTNTIVYVDWDGNPANSTLSAPNGQKYDIAYTVNALQSVRLYDSKFNDSDQSGARLFTTDGALIAVAYGEDQTPQRDVPNPLSTPLTTNINNNPNFGSTASSPYLDVGTNVLPLPALAIKKFINGQDADSPTGPVILVGSTATFTYNVSNNGGNPLKNVTVVDDGGPDSSFAPNPEVNSGGFNIGDGNSDNKLDTGEIWKYKATKTVTAGQYTNIATVNAKDLSGQDVAPDADPANYLGVVGAVVIEKQVSLDGINWFDADSPTGPVVIVGQNVKYRVAVTNNSTGGLAATVDLSDAVIIGSISALDFKFSGNQTTSVAAGATIYSDVITTTALAGQQTDQASATATITDGTNTTSVTVAPDNANYLGVVGAVVIEKQVSLDGINWFDADSPTGPVVIVGQNVKYRVAVTNNSTGGLAATVDLSDAVIIGSISALDFKFSGNQTTSVAAGATIYSDVITTTALAGQQTDQASATATITDGTNTTSVTVAPDNANYFGQNLQGDLKITKTDYLTKVVPGQCVTYTIVVSNCGPDTATHALVEDLFPSNLTDVKWTSKAAKGATDNKARGTDNIEDYVTLPAGSSITYKVTGTVVGGPGSHKVSDCHRTLTNTATVTAPSDFTDTNLENNTATDIDTIMAAPGVRNTHFWQNTKWQKSWDGIQGNEHSQKTRPNFPDSDLLLSPYTNSARSGKVLDPITRRYGVGLLIGDYNHNGKTDKKENTLFYTRAQALQIVDSSMHPNNRDTRYILGRDLVTSWLNYLAGNSIDTPNSNDQDARDYINEGIQWLQALTPDQNRDGKGDGYLQGLTGNETSNSRTPRILATSSYWKSGISSASNLPNSYKSNTDVLYPIDAGISIHTHLDNYNNNIF
jgi:uncharacterized repeat protein (TIGR01451 family)